MAVAVCLSDQQLTEQRSPIQADGDVGRGELLLEDDFVELIGKHQGLCVQEEEEEEEEEDSTIRHAMTVAILFSTVIQRHLQLGQRCVVKVGPAWR